YRVVFKFFLARSLGVRALGESEDVARVDTSLPCFSSVSRLLSAGGSAVAAPSRTALAAFSSRASAAALRENGSGSTRLTGCFFAVFLSLCCEDWLRQCRR